MSISLDREDSWIRPVSNGAYLNIGARRVDLAELAAEYGKKASEAWLRRDRSLPVDALIDGVSAEECATIAEDGDRPSIRAVYDIRGTRPTVEEINRIADCGGALGVLVDETAAAELGPRKDELPVSVDVAFLRDLSASIEPDCATAIGADSDRETLATCVSALAAAENFRMGIVSVRNP
ncbi:hypothetical protein ALI22I_17145 [Saccharothrix sp. ALI-22-I]|uniref:hypothetical protein n=1 Tax=Saccharothrix sp. ALI-22-I TaxID=1933778 RepID=UPI00097CB16F|nr:hypothetical protein [Saccharothrix sp. ALI-22-I]ONI89221.1 hypothetical protein ALI22I_17145 [Saccharothrix sp. ALI-22-I]